MGTLKYSSIHTRYSSYFIEADSPFTISFKIKRKSIAFFVMAQLLSAI